MRFLDPDLVRALVRQALEEELGLTSMQTERPRGERGQGASRGGERLLEERAAPTGAAGLPIRSHPSHLEVVSECGGESDLSHHKPCLIEPHRLCSNSGYCKKLGY